MTANLRSRPPALRAPFPYFGGKSAVGRHVWEAFGPVTHYVEPFAGSLGVLLSVPADPIAGSRRGCAP